MVNDTSSLLNDHILGITWYSAGCEFIRWREFVTTHRNISWNPKYVFNSWNLLTESPIFFVFPITTRSTWWCDRSEEDAYSSIAPFMFFSLPLSCTALRSSKIKSFVTYWWSRRKHYSLLLLFRLPVILFQVDFMLLFGEFFW